MPSTAPRYPGIPSTADGSAAVLWVECAISEAATAYPITPTTNMGAGYQEKVSNGAKNLWGTPLAFLELESEHSAASSCEGFALAGGRVANFTSGQGLVLMKEVLFTISGKRLPVVFNIGARALTSHSLNVHCGHDDIMAVTDVGWGMLFGRNAQEAADLALIARRTAEDTATPFFSVQDGFLTTHTVENILLPEPELMKDYVGDPKERLRDFSDPERALMVGVVQNQDSYMKGKLAQRYYYDKVKAALKQNMRRYSELTGRPYDLLSTYKMEDAEAAIVGMGSGMETAQAVVDHVRGKLGLKLGLVHVTSFRPFPAEEIVAALRGVKSFSVIERLDVPLAQSNPLALEIKAAFADAAQEDGPGPHVLMIPEILSGIYGLGSRDFRLADAVAVARNMMEGRRRLFACNLKHPLALPEEAEPDLRREGDFAMRGHSVGGYGSVTTNKVIATLAEELFGLRVQAYPKYGSEKKGLPTTFYLQLSEHPILTHCELSHVDFVPVLDATAFFSGNPLAGLSPGGAVLLQSAEADPAKVWASLPPEARQRIAAKGIRVLYLDMVAVARELSPSEDLAQRMQGIVLLGVFLKLTPYQKRKGLAEADLFTKMRKTLEKYFGRRGANVVDANLEAVRRGYTGILEVPAALIAKDLKKEVAR